MLDAKKIEKIIRSIAFVQDLVITEYQDSVIGGSVKINFDGLDSALEFQFMILPPYPLKCFNSESIKFINTDLIEFNHVMEDGSICIHTATSKKIEEKLAIDFNSLKNWIEKYYVNKDSDINYEHIIIPDSTPQDGNSFNYMFTQTDYKFQKNDYGLVNLSFMNKTILKDKPNGNFVVQSFVMKGKTILCGWSESFIAQFPKSHIALFLFLKNSPAKHKKFAFTNYSELESYFDKEFRDFLFLYQNKLPAGTSFPLFLGYETVDDQIHWQAAIINKNKSPFFKDYSLKDKIYVPEIKVKSDDIVWAKTHDSSYNYFFGRGKLSDKITNSKILIIGVGAVGSMVAKTLVKCGCRFLDLADYDMKIPENVCRSEYTFSHGVSEKVFELGSCLIRDSPFVTVNTFNINSIFFETIKSVYKNREGSIKCSEILNSYDIIFDCTTDNDLMYVLDSFDLKCDLINFSISNHAKDLVCAFYPNIYSFVSTAFEIINKDNDLSDLHEPVGCWSPTFKASYNDVNFLVQAAIKQINRIYLNKTSRSNFILRTDLTGELKLEMEHY